MYWSGARLGGRGGGGTGGISGDELGGDLVFAALRVGRAGKFVQGVGGDLAEHVAMNIDGGNGGIAVFGEASFVEAGDGDVFGDAAAGFHQSLDNADGGEIVDGHDRGGAGAELGDGQAGAEAALETQIAG